MTETQQNTAKEVTEIIKRKKEDRIIQATRIANLFHKYQKWLRTNYETTDFKQPILFFERRSGDVEFYENVTTGLFEYKHSDGTNRYIIITPNKQKKFGFADKIFKGYYCHEDYPTPLPDNPFLTVEQVNIMVDKALNDIKEWKTKEIEANTNFIKTIGFIVLGGIILFILYKMVIPPQVQAPIVQTITNQTTHTLVTTLNNTQVI